MICSKCNTNNPEGSIYCNCCGTPLPTEDITADPHENYAMVWSVICYLSIIGWIISIAGGDKNNLFVRTHQNNGLVLIIFSVGGSIVMLIPIIGWIVGAAAMIWSFVDKIIGIVWTLQGKRKEVPVLGNIHILK